jgi:O-antigen/teichoic acid export membrane protein
VVVSTTQNVAKNTVLLTVGLLSGRLLALFVIKKMAPILGPEGVGIWGFANDLTIILLVVTNFGLGTLLTREVTKARGMTLPIFWAALRIRWLLGLLCYLALVAYLYGKGYAPLTRAAVLVTGLALFVETTSMACDAVLQAHEKVQYQALGQLVSGLVYFGLAYWWLDAGYGVMGVVWANLASRVARLLVMAPLMLVKTGPWRWRVPDGGPTPNLRWMLGLGLPLFLSTTFGIVSYKVDTVMLNHMLGEVATGIYVLGHRALDYLLYLPNIFATALFPVLTRYGMQSATDARRLGDRALLYMLATMLPLTFFVMAVAEPVIHWFDPSPRFADSVPVLQIVVWGVPFQAVNTILNRLLFVAERERRSSPSAWSP